MLLVLEKSELPYDICLCVRYTGKNMCDISYIANTLFLNWLMGMYTINLQGVLELVNWLILSVHVIAPEMNFNFCHFIYSEPQYFSRYGESFKGLVQN